MTYPILVSPRQNTSVIIEFISERTGRIILASSKAKVGDFGYNSPIGYIIDNWYPCNEDTLHTGRAWISPASRLFHLCPYIADQYPELLI